MYSLKKVNVIEDHMLAVECIVLKADVIESTHFCLVPASVHSSSTSACVLDEVTSLPLSECTAWSADKVWLLACCLLLIFPGGK